MCSIKYVLSIIQTTVALWREHTEKMDKDIGDGFKYSTRVFAHVEAERNVNMPRVQEFRERNKRNKSYETLGPPPLSGLEFVIQPDRRMIDNF